MYPEFIDKLLWGGKVVGIRVALESAKPTVVKALLTSAWKYKSAQARGGKATSSQSGAKP